jgi:hypothetical protein
MATACGRVGFDPLGGSGDGGTDSGVIDGGPTDAMPDGTSDVSVDGAIDASGDGGLPTAPIYLKYERVEYPSGLTLTALGGDLVGDVSLVSIGPGVSDMVLRYAPLEGGVPNQEPIFIRGRITQQTDGRFLLEPTTAGRPDAVLFLEVSAGRWTFTLDESDPRNAEALTQYVVVSVLSQSTPPSTSTRGSWNVDTFRAPGIVFPSGVCTAVSGGFGFGVATYTIDPLGETTATQDAGLYSDAGCTMELMRAEAAFVGFLVETGASQARGLFWEQLGGEGVRVVYDYVLVTPDRLTLDLVSCTPSSACGSVTSVDMSLIAP